MLLCARFCELLLLMRGLKCLLYFFFFNDTATTEIYTLSLHDALPIYGVAGADGLPQPRGHQLEQVVAAAVAQGVVDQLEARSEEHTSELQSRQYLVCRLLLEKKKITTIRSSYLYLHT